jgi:hypothetical protein
MVFISAAQKATPAKNQTSKAVEQVPVSLEIILGQVLPWAMAHRQKEQMEAI